MMRFIQKVSDKFYLRGVPRILYSMRNLVKRSSKLYHDPEGIQLYLNLDNYFQNNILYGYYEYSVRSLIKQILRPGDIMLDIGGNIGYMAILAALKVGESGKVITFEPNPDVQDILLKNVSINKLENIELIPAAVSDENGNAVFYCGEEHALSTLIEDSKVLKIKNTLTVKTVTVDTILSERNIHPNEVALVKIDIEGYEYLALKGMNMLLQNRKAIFIVENNPPAQTALGINLEHILNEHFYSNGYKVFWIESKSNKSIFYRKSIEMIEIDRNNIQNFVNRSGDFLAKPS